MATHYRYHGPRIVYIVSVLFFMIAASLAVFYASGYTIDPQRWAVTKTGLLVVHSQPTGATIALNGQPQADRTDTRLKLLPGSYRASVSKPGTLPWEKQLTIEEGQAVLEESILLFASQPKATELARDGVLTRTISPNRKQVAFVRTDPTELGLWLGPVDGRTSAGKLVGLPASYAAPTSLVFSSDGSRLALSTPTETLIVTSNGQTVGPLAIGGTPRFAPGQSDRLLFVQSQQLVAINVSDRSQQLIEDQVDTWTTTGEAVYVARPDGTLVQRDLRANSRRIITNTTPLRELVGIQAADTLYLRSAAGGLLTLDGDKLLEISPLAGPFAANPDGSVVAYLANRELVLWQRQTKQGRLVSRFTNPIDGLALLTGNAYILYNRGAELHSIAADGSNDVTLPVSGAAALDLADGNTVLASDASRRSLSAIQLLGDGS